MELNRQGKLIKSIARGKRAWIQLWLKKKDGNVFKHWGADLKKNAHHESCELSFIWDKMRTVAQETASQIALRNCSKEVGGTISVYVIFVKEEYIQSSTFFFLRFLKINFIFYWRIIALQNFAVFCQTSTLISHKYTYILSLLKLPSIYLPIPPI